MSTPPRIFRLFREFSFVLFTSFTSLSVYCYYYLYLRHSNNVAVVHNTMEFGIVRNNLYRFMLTSVTGPGTPTLDPRDPEELKARVYVKKWLMVEHPPIYL